MGSTEKDNVQLVEEFRDLIRIPQFKASLYHKIEEMKITLREMIKNYRATSRVVVAPEKEMPEKGAIPSPNRMVFEIHRNKAGWKLSLPGPLPGPHALRHYFPQQLFDYIINMELSPHAIFTEKFTDIPGRVFELSIVKQSDSFITGTVVETTDNERFLEIAGPQLAAAANEKGKYEDLKIFLNYLVKHEILYNVMMEEFKSCWKPFIDNKFILDL